MRAAARYLLDGSADLDRLRALVSQDRAGLAGVPAGQVPPRRSPAAE
jgi:hypothetical protein